MFLKDYLIAMKIIVSGLKRIKQMRIGDYIILKDMWAKNKFVIANLETFLIIQSEIIDLATAVDQAVKWSLERT